LAFRFHIQKRKLLLTLQCVKKNRCCEATDLSRLFEDSTFFRRFALNSCVAYKNDYSEKVTLFVRKKINAPRPRAQ